MPQGFARTGSLLEADSFRGAGLKLLLAAMLSGAWIWWFTQTKVPLYEVTETARLESSDAPYKVEAEISGRLISANLRIQREVKQGDELAVLASEVQQMERSEAQTRIAGLQQNIRARQEELDAVRRGVESDHRTTEAEIRVTEEELRGANLKRAHLETELARIRALKKEGLIAAAELPRAETALAEQRATIERLHRLIEQKKEEKGRKDSERKIREQEIQTQIERDRADVANVTSTLPRAGHEIGRRVIRAPVAGIIGAAPTLQPGAFVPAGTELATILPAGGQVIIVAQYEPAAAFGRIGQEQKARMRLNGYPWAQYGFVHGEVINVAKEARAGTVRVDLAIVNPKPAAVQLDHGLPGSVEIVVDRVSPAELALRLAGNWVGAPRQGRK